MFLLRVFSALVALLLLVSVRAEMNVTIDDKDPRISYQPAGVWTFLDDNDATQDRLGKTTHFTNQIGSTASLTFTGAVYVYFVGYPIVPMSPPALIPMTLQPWHGSAITVESDAYRAPGTPAQIILFSSNRLDPTETYTLTVTKTNATLKNDLNIDAFILTQPDGAGSTSPPAQATVISGTTYSGPVVSLGTQGTQGATSSGNPTQTSLVTNAPNTDASINAGAIAGGVLGGIVAGITIMFFATRWWLRRGQRSRQPDGLPILPFSVETPHPVYFNTVAATYPSMNSGAPPRAIISSTTGRRLVPSVQVKTQYAGNSQPNNFPSATSLPAPVVSSPEDTSYSEITLPAYSQI